MISVLPVDNEKTLKQFVEFPFALYKDNRYWVPPIKKEVYRLFDKDHNPFWQHTERQLFLVFRDRNVVARACAMVDYNFIEFWGEKTGYFGFFEAERDPDAVRILFDEIRKFQSEKGMTSYIGPFNPSTNDECGMLFEGYFSPPYIMMTYNPDYYHELMKTAGLEKAKDLYAHFFDMKDARLDYLERMASIVRGRVSNMRVRPVNLNDFDAEVKRIREVYNDAWSRNWGFVPMTDAEFVLLAHNLRPGVVPELMLIVEVDNQPAAVSLTLPNYNLLFQKFNGRLGPIEMLKFALNKKKIREARLIIMGVKKQFRKMGMEGLMLLESIKNGQKMGITGGELSWTLEDNYPINNTIAKMGGKVYKKYRVYRGRV
jgi:hypothetical protein